MKQAINLFRKPNHFNNLLQFSLRGGKKKKDNVGTLLSADIVNIFKDRKDPMLHDIDSYPVWLKEFMVFPTKELSLMTMGEMHHMHSARYRLDDVTTLLRQHRKEKMKQLNGWKRLSAEKLRDDDGSDAEEMLVPVELAEVDSIGALIRRRMEEMIEKARMEAQEAEAAGEEGEEEDEEGAKKPGRPTDPDQDEIK